MITPAQITAGAIAGNVTDEKAREIIEGYLAYLESHRSEIRRQFIKDIRAGKAVGFVNEGDNEQGYAELVEATAPTPGATEALAKIIALRDDYESALARRENGVTAGIKFHEAVFSLLYQKTIEDFFHPGIIVGEDSGISEMVLEDCAHIVGDEMTVRPLLRMNADKEQRDIVGFQWWTKGSAAPQPVSADDRAKDGNRPWDSGNDETTIRARHNYDWPPGDGT